MKPIEDSPKPEQAPPPRVSVIIPVYNQAWCIRDTVASLLVQTLRSLEVILVDDGSTDESWAVLNNLVAEGHRTPIGIARQSNQKPAVARNNAAECARGEYLMPLDGDDGLHPEALEHFVRALDKDRQAGFAYSDQQLFGDASWVERSEPWDPARLAEQNYIPVASMVRKAAFDVVGGYRPEEEHFSDYGLWLSLAEHGYHGVYVPKPLFRYRRHFQSHSLGVSPPERERLMGIVRRNHPKSFGGNGSK